LSISSSGNAPPPQQWNSSDPANLGQAAKGAMGPGILSPRSMAPVRYPVGRSVTGACYDPASRRPYLCVAWGWPDGLESHPVVHVYEVRDVPHPTSRPKP
jgi:hypothetical protein